MICMKCQQEGKRSYVNIGGSMRTLAGSFQYYNEDGKLAMNDPNITTAYYSCSNGHQWSEIK